MSADTNKPAAPEQSPAPETALITNGTRQKLRLCRAKLPEGAAAPGLHVLVSNEDPRQLLALQSSTRDQFEPQNLFETVLSDLATHNLWRTIRLANFGAAALDCAVVERAANIDRNYEGGDDQVRLYLAMRDSQLSRPLGEMQRLEIESLRQVTSIGRELKRSNRSKAK